MHTIELTGPGDVGSTIRFRPVTGQDELLVENADPNSALQLLSRLALDESGSSLDLEQLTLSQIDRLLAALYGLLYGDRADCRVRCASCGEDYEFTLYLSKLMTTQDAERPGASELDGAWTLPDKRRLRAPQLRDVQAAADSASLLARLVVSGDPSLNPEEATGFLERAAPVLSLDLTAPCPHCEKDQTARFDLACYLARRLAAEHSFLLRETHLIASTYGWSHQEIMQLSRDDRRAFAGLIEAGRVSSRTARRSR